MYEFPCDYPIKAIGLANPEFEFAVFSILEKHVDKLEDCQVSRKMSRYDKYISITVSITAESHSQLEALYRDLTSHELVLVVL